MDLKNVSTKELVEELALREAVEPYEACSITVGDEEVYNDGGPIVILRIWD